MSASRLYLPGPGPAEEGTNGQPYRRRHGARVVALLKLMAAFLPCRVHPPCGKSDHQDPLLSL